MTDGGVARGPVFLVVAVVRTWAGGIENGSASPVTDEAGTGSVLDDRPSTVLAAPPCSARTEGEP